MSDQTGAHEVGSEKMLSVTIVTPSGARAVIQAKQVRAPGADGEFGVLPGHVPFLTTLRVGAIVIDTSTGKQIWATSGGFAEIHADRVTILAEQAELAESIDVVRAEAAKRRALDRLANRNSEIVDLDRANAALARAINRIRVASSSNVNS